MAGGDFLKMIIFKYGGKAKNDRIDTMNNISAVVNTLNEEKNIKRCLLSLKPLVEEVIVVDMHSSDKTAALARDLGAKVYTHSRIGYVEPARNYAISKAKGKWILVIDADEEVSPALRQRIENIIAEPENYTFFRLPRKNIIFGKWIRHGLWWPDYQIRLFQKGYVEWREEIHSIPYTRGQGLDLPAKEEYAIVHHNYQTICQFIERLNRYTSQQAKEKMESDYEFKWQNVVKAPFQEFIRRFFLAEGYKDGFHGLSLSLLQAFSELVVYLKLWELKKFPQIKEESIKKELPQILVVHNKELKYWLTKKKFTSDWKTRLKSIVS